MGIVGSGGSPYYPMGDGLISDSIISGTDLFFYTTTEAEKITIMSDVTVTGSIITDGTSIEYVSVDPPAVPDQSDINQDGHVNLVDYSIVAGDWLTCSDPAESLCDQYWN